MVKRGKLSASKRLTAFGEWFTVPKEESTARPSSYREMLRYADKLDYLLVVVGLTCCCITGALSPLNMIPFQGIVNVLITGEQEYQEGRLDKDNFSAGIQQFAWIYFAFGICTFLFNFIGLTSLYTVCERQVHAYRKKYLQSVLHQDMAWFDHNEVGSLTHKMSANIEKIKDGASDKIGIMVQAMGALIAGITIALYQDWRMTLVALGIIPLMVFALFGSRRALEASVYKEMNAYSAAGAIAQEVINGIRTVMSFNAQPYELERYSNQLKKGQVIGVRKVAITGFFSALNELIMFFFMGGVFYYGTTLVVYAGTSSGTVFSVFWAVLTGAMSLGMALPQMNVLLSAKIAAAEIFEVIDRQPELNCKSKSGIKLNNVKGKIELSNIHFKYPSRPDIKILDGISFTVEPGQTVALVGHSGCGKSTIISLLMRYYNQEEGGITLDGVPLEDINITWLRSVIGIVSQEPSIFQTTIAENLRFGRPDVTPQEMEAACRMANAHDFILKLPQGYETFIGDGGIKLSGGQKQRLAIARALVRNPKILLLDEATSALDTESERVVQAAIDAVSTGRTTITIAHRLSTVRNANKIIVFDKGNIVETGTHDELLQREDGVYKQLVAAQKITAEKTKENVSDVQEQKEEEVLSLTQQQSLRASERMRRSIASVREPEGQTLYLEDKIDELELQGGKVATICDMYRYVRPELSLFAIGLFLSLVRGCCWPSFALVYGRLFKALSEFQSSGDPGTILYDSAINTVLFAIIGIVGACTTFSSGYFLGKAGESVAYRLRVSVYKNLLRQDATYYDTPGHSVGALTSRLSQDAANVQAAIDQRLAEMLQGVTSLIAGIVIGFTFGWNMVPFCIFLASLLTVIQTIFSTYLKYRGMTDAKAAGEASRLATESISNVKTIQSLTRQEYVYDRFKEASVIPHRRAIIRNAIMSVSFATSSCYISMNFWASYLFGMWLVYNDWSTPYTVFQVIEALNVAAMIISRSSSYLPQFIRARISAGLMFGMMHEQPKIDSWSTWGEIMPIRGDIKVDNVSFSYPSTKKTLTLNNLNLASNIGQTVALVGPSGCGKSTVIQLLERYYDVNAGLLTVDGVDVRKINIRHLRSAVALVSQEPTLFNLSIRDNIAYGLLDVTDEAIEAAAKFANIDAFVRSLSHGYDTSVGACGTQLSGGQKQRIAIARAVIREPKILLLDEATAALDGESERLVQEALDRVRSGRTCIVVAHRLSTIQNADLICVIQNGSCFESGTHQQLLERRGLYYRLVKSQSMA